MDLASMGFCRNDRALGVAAETPERALVMYRRRGCPWCKAGIATSARSIRAGTLQFCSAILSRRTMEADPVNLAFCRYIVFACEQADAAGVIHVGYRRLPEAGDEESRAPLCEVNALLDEIVRDAIGR
jgi:hypothetical protein